MRNKILSLFSVLLLLCAAGQVSAQGSSKGTDCQTGLGIRLDFGSGGGTYFGFSAKRFFTEAGAGEAHLLFATGSTLLGLEYQHHFPIPTAPGLKWYVGAGPGFAFGGGSTSVLLRPIGGLEYKIQAAPVNLGFDWRPVIGISNASGFEAGRFGLAFRYAF